MTAGTSPAPPDPAGIAATVREVWSAATGDPEPQDGDDFFDVGGTSVRALSVVAELDRRLGTTLPVTAVLDSPELAALVATVTDHCR